MRNLVAVVIVTHNSASEVRSCLRALRQQAWREDGGGLVAEVIVVDNASGDGTCSVVENEAPAATLIRNSANRGFAAAVNQAVQLSVSPLVLLLNPDAFLETGIEDLVRAFDSPDVAAAAGKLVDPAGVWQRGFNVRSFPTPAALACEVLLLNRIWASNPVNRRYRRLDFDPDKAQDVEQPAGAFLMFRRDAWEKLGGLDERFHPLWFEDVDFCLRIRRSGARIRYVPGVVTRHAGAHSIRQASVQFQQVAWYCSLLQFCNKHFSHGTQRWLRAAAAIGLSARWCLCWFGVAGRSKQKAYGSALKMVMGSQAARSVSAPVGRTTIVES